MLVSKVKATTAFALRLEFNSGREAQGPAAIEIAPDAAREALACLVKAIPDLDANPGGHAVLKLGGASFKLDAENIRILCQVLTDGISNLENDRAVIEAAAEQDQERRRAAGFSPRAESIRVIRNAGLEIESLEKSFQY